jgi:two-component system, OmpR family, sensor kinase
VIAPAGRLLGLTVLVLAAALGIAALIGMRTAREFADEAAQSLNRNMAMYVAARGALITRGQADVPTLTEIAAQAMILNPSARLFVLDATGQPIWPVPGNAPLRRRVDLYDVHRFLASESRSATAIYGTDPDHPTLRRVFSAAPVDGISGRQGYVYVVFDSHLHVSSIAAVASSHALALGAASVLLVLLLGGLVSWALGAWLTRPLEALHRRIVETDLELIGRHAAEDQSDASDLDRVRTSFDRLSATIRARVAQLRDNDLERRELFAHVSHDLRTPVTAIRGYLETLKLDGEDMSIEERREFFDVALKHCDRLHRLIEQAFLLAKLELAALPVRTGPVRVDELARAVTTKWRRRARAVGIDLRCDAPATPPSAMADPGLLETVLDNLIENALRHCRDGGSILIRVTETDQGVNVAVQDDGCGFDAASALSCRGGKTATTEERAGFGLAIVRRALALHGSRLNLTSTAIAGTCASFDLHERQPSNPDRVPTVMNP